MTQSLPKAMPQNTAQSPNSHVTLSTMSFSLLMALWATALRLWDLKQPFLGDYAWNEVYYAHIARSFVRGGWPLQPAIDSGGYFYSSPLVPSLIAGSFALFGDAEWAARAVMLLFGGATLLAFYAFVRVAYTAQLAAASTLLAAFAPGIVFFSRNVQLDGAMAAFGWASLATLVTYRRGHRRVWLWVSGISFSLSVLCKFTGVLFWPALAWAWFSDSRGHGIRSWLRLCAFTAVSILPSVLWLVWILSVEQSSIHATAPGSLTVTGYFLRFHELTLSNLARASIATWSNTLNHLGPAILYPGVLLGILLANGTDWRCSLRRYALPILAIVPWYLQIAYPSAWIANEYYDYPALYAMCILLAALALRGYAWLRASCGMSLRASTVAVMVVLLGVASSWSYRNSFHASYYPWPLISQPTPYYSARHVAQVNLAGAPVLADLPMTLYYAEASAPDSRYVWWGSSDRATIAAIQSLDYEYIVFTYPPTLGIASALVESGYHRIAPSAWQLHP